ncbi:hypothetical protein BKA65DRAFT_556444 [Rhexocercosporidium sp. MPI-PUGE-AT-0058]|nr:hypothetical protein BKA65DRAFT_556444 [Rhexocercosporidium sp. MPI-PUGE-AT-0058]
MPKLNRSSVGQRTSSDEDCNSPYKLQKCRKHLATPPACNHGRHARKTHRRRSEALTPAYHGELPRSRRDSMFSQLDDMEDLESKEAFVGKEFCLDEAANRGYSIKLRQAEDVLTVGMDRAEDSQAQSQRGRARAKAALEDEYDIKEAMDEETCPNYEALREAIDGAVKCGKIEAEEIYGIHLTIESITEFFKKNRESLMDVQLETQSDKPNRGMKTAKRVYDPAKQPFDILQTSFVFARSQLRHETIESDVKERKLKDKEELKKAIMLYKKQSSSGIDQKKIMASICKILKDDSTPKWKLTSQVDARKASCPQPRAKTGQKPQLNVEPPKKFLAGEPEPLPFSPKRCHETTSSSGFDETIALNFRGRDTQRDATDWPSRPLEFTLFGASEQAVPITGSSRSTPSKGSGQKDKKRKETPASQIARQDNESFRFHGRSSNR